MTKPVSFGEINVDVRAGRDRAAHALDPETPFRIAILGDFSGRASRGVCETGPALASRRAVVIDRDNFDEVLSKLDVQLSLPVAGDHGPRLELSFHELDDFHPDRIFERTDVFRKLKETRAKLADPQTFAAAVRSSQAVREQRPADLQSTSAPVELFRSSLLDQVAGATEGRAAGATPSRARDEWGEFLQQIVEPHLVPNPDPRQPEILAQVDQATSGLMRSLLHHTDFQALEAAWRAVFFLVRKVETHAQLKLCLLDVSKTDLAADLASAHDLSQTGIYKLLVEKTVGSPGAEPWAVLVGSYTWGPARDDAELLGRLARIASAAGAPFLSAASPRLLGCASFAETPNPRDWSGRKDAESAQSWEILRKLPQASSVGLALPRFLLRLPYGKKTDATECFDFEEMPQTPDHEEYLWGNPAFACALLLAQAFTEDGWNLRPGGNAEIDGLPLHIYQAEGTARAKPCAEALFTEEAVEAILEKGFMPLVSQKERDAIRLVRVQSLADPLAALSGRWRIP
jgi:type VI secretion system protein ImpC